MLQALIKKGRVVPRDVPAPMVSEKSALIKVVNSCISAGTELSGVQSAGKSLIQRAIQQPEKIKKALNLAKTEGIFKTVEKIRGKMETVETPTGYSIAGIVIATGGGITDIRPGDSVAAAGAGIANHAEYVDVPRNLIMRIPEGLDFQKASTVTLGGIAMQGVRRANVSLGEFVVVFGAGILGQLALQMLRVSGARVIAVDLDENRLRLAKTMGAETCFNPKTCDPIQSVRHYTNGHGADAVLFCAATDNSQSLSDAFAMTRKKGRLVMVGVWGKELRREDMYQKELDFLISTSYGPGRYDPVYEKDGLDYPYAYVRWTENRNMEEYLRLLSDGKVDAGPLIQAVYPLDQVETAFASLQMPDRPLMVLLDYGSDLPEDLSALARHPRQVVNPSGIKTRESDRIRVGIVGAGGFATGMHLPNLQKLGDRYEIHAICNRTGSKARNVCSKYGAKYATTDYLDILRDAHVDLVMICTRHDLHGEMVLKSLEAGKHTFVEKPLCARREELDRIRAWHSSQIKDGNSNMPLLMVGYNRRFSKYAAEIKKLAAERINPLFIRYRMNAGHIPLDHWVHSEEGGGRIVGEACHIVDLFSYLTESPIRTFGAASLVPRTGSLKSSDNKSIIFEYEDGSVAALDYFATGSKELQKEYMEVHFDGKTVILNDYKSLEGFGVTAPNLRTDTSEKGQLEELERLAETLNGNDPNWPIEFWDLAQTTDVTLEINEM